MTVRNYAVVAGDRLTDSFPLKDPGQGYDLRVYGPNGFFRAFTGGRNDPALSVQMEYEFGKDQRPTGRLLLKVVNEDNKPCKLVLTDNAYKESLDRPGDRVLGPKDMAQMVLDPGKHGGWYDWSLRVAGVKGFEKRYAGRVETGKDSISDPAMG
jgi:phospholipase C